MSATSSLFNQRIKYYPSKEGGQILAEVCTFSEPVFNPRHLEIFSEGKDERGGKKRGASEEIGTDSTEVNKRSEINAIKRARKRVFDLIACNPDCNLFVTLTLDGARIQRDDWSAVIRRVSDWLDNNVRRNALRYVLVPEFHADGVNIHFHGVMNADAVRLADSGHKRGGKTVYNVQSWGFGFSTAQKIGGSESDHIKVTKYISKYMTKQIRAAEQGGTEATEKVGGRYFLHGGELREPIYEYRNAPFEEADGFAVNITEYLSCKVDTML